MKESALAHKYLDGLKGVEIGGASNNSFGLDTINVDITENSLSARKSAEQGFEPMKVDIIAPGDDLPFLDKSYGFVVSSHVIEHFYDPIKTLLEWKRIAEKYIFIICPDKGRIFDKDKETTTLAELIVRHNNVDIKRIRGHQSYWTLSVFLELCNYLKLKVIEFRNPDDKVGNGFMVLIKLD